MHAKATMVVLDSNSQQLHAEQSTMMIATGRRRCRARRRQRHLKATSMSQMEALSGYCDERPAAGAGCTRLSGDTSDGSE